jgi:hypothetical protein
MWFAALPSMKRERFMATADVEPGMVRVTVHGLVKRMRHKWSSPTASSVNGWQFLDWGVFSLPAVDGINPALGIVIPAADMHRSYQKKLATYLRGWFDAYHHGCEVRAQSGSVTVIGRSMGLCGWTSSGRGLRRWKSSCVTCAERTSIWRPNRGSAISVSPRWKKSVV